IGEVDCKHTTTCSNIRRKFSRWNRAYHYGMFSNSRTFVSVCRYTQCNSEFTRRREGVIKGLTVVELRTLIERHAVIRQVPLPCSYDFSANRSVRRRIRKGHWIPVADTGIVKVRAWIFEDTNVDFINTFTPGELILDIKPDAVQARAGEHLIERTWRCRRVTRGRLTSHDVVVFIVKLPPPPCGRRGCSRRNIMEANVKVGQRCLSDLTEIRIYRNIVKVR